MRQRIQTLDGLRFLAALGVLWIHVWRTYGYPRCYIGKIDVADLLAIGGNGVDLFFVISGFCMYYFYASKTDFSYHDFYRFLIKRWVRLSPAFYVSAIIYMLIEKFIYHHQFDGVSSLLYSVFYLNIFEQNSPAPHFWTLSVEWQFYFTVPFLLIYQNKIGFKKIFFIIFGFLFSIALVSVFIVKGQLDLLTKTILFRGLEFGCGIISARLLMKNNAFFKNRILWLIMFVIIIYAGRVFISQSVLGLSNNYYNVFKLFGFSLMGCGFAGILYLSITSVKWLNNILGNKVFKTMGRISFSFYLLHALIVPVVGGYTMEFMPFTKGITAPIVTTCICAIILYPISKLSYHLLEKPFLSIGNLTTK